MKQVSKSNCPKCGSEDFITRPNRYDWLRFVNGQFQVEKSEFTNERVRVFCRECGTEIDEKSSLENKKVVLGTTR